ncbi:hypothetical protein SS05631_c28570 [Sinorhizobium sp. CCBAU 05631]|nr:hypothetical protein SS05631_c28570 [Sinorhizobium sp. CCBAU 05631]
MKTLHQNVRAMPRRSCLPSRRGLFRCIDRGYTIGNIAIGNAGDYISTRGVDHFKCAVFFCRNPFAADEQLRRSIANYGSRGGRDKGSRFLRGSWFHVQHLRYQSGLTRDQYKIGFEIGVNIDQIGCGNKLRSP